MTTVSPEAVDIAQARQKLAQAEEQAAAYRRQIEQEEAEREAARLRRLDAWDKQAVADYPAQTEALQAEERQAYEEFRAAVLADPVYSAWIRHRAARLRRSKLNENTAGAMERLNLPGNRPNPLSYADARLLEDVIRFCDDEAGQIAADEQEDRFEAREAAGNGDAP